MTKTITLSLCGNGCLDFRLLPCRQMSGEKAPYCTYEHPFRALEKEGISFTAFPDFCPLEDDKPQTAAEEDKEKAEPIHSLSYAMNKQWLEEMAEAKKEEVCEVCNISENCSRRLGDICLADICKRKV